MKYNWEFSETSIDYPATLYVPNAWESFKNIKDDYIKLGRFKVIIGKELNESKYYYWIVMFEGSKSVFGFNYKTVEEAIEASEVKIEQIFGCGRDLLNSTLCK